MAKGLALHIGVDTLCATHPYYRDFSDLHCAKNGAKYFQRVTEEMKFEESVCLLDIEATRERVLSILEGYASKLADDDLFVLTFSGHGVQEFEDDGPFDNGKDEFWCFSDDLLMDDTITRWILNFEASSRIIVISDCCYGGGILDLREYLNQGSSPVYLMAASHEDQVAYQHEIYSAFTYCIKKELFENPLSYSSLADGVRKRMKEKKLRHSPRFKSFGSNQEGLVGQKPFAI